MLKPKFAMDDACIYWVFLQEMPIFAVNKIQRENMASDYQLKKESFGSLVEQIRVDNMEYFRGKTMSRVYMIGKSNDDQPALLFPKNDVPNDIKDKLNDAFKSIFLDAE